MIQSSDKLMLNMMILEILQQYTDAGHRLEQNEILRLLDMNYGVTCTRKTLYNNLQALRRAGYDISTDTAKGGTCLVTRTFTDSELCLLINSVLYSRTLTHKQAKSLIGKLESMGSRYFHRNVSHVCNLPDMVHADNDQLMDDVSRISRAIGSHRKISFIYNSYGTDFRIHPRREEPYIFNPYQIAANTGHFYVIGNYDKYDSVSYYRIDRMTEVMVLDEPVKPMRQVKGLENGLHLPRHMAEHLYMFSGPSVCVTLAAPISMMDDLVDWFGKGFHIVKQDGDRMEVRVSANEEAMLYWALQFGRYVEVKKPLTLRNRIRDTVRQMADTYGEPSSDGRRTDGRAAGIGAGTSMAAQEVLQDSHSVLK